MLFLSSRPTLRKSGLLQGATDHHSHILPGVDDGFQTMDESLKALETLEKEGVHTIWLTPHIMEDVPNNLTDLQRRFNDLKSAYHGPILLKLAAEHMLDLLFAERMENDQLIPHGKVNGDTRIMVETSYYSAPSNLSALLSGLKLRGFRPILAHPERYRYMSHEHYLRLKDRGILLQINLSSLLGIYGNTAKNNALWLLNHNMVDLCGTDLHSYDSLMRQLDMKLPSRKAVRRLEEIMHQ